MSVIVQYQQTSSYNPENMTGKIMEVQTDYRDQRQGRTISTGRPSESPGVVFMNSVWLASFYAPRMPLYPLFIPYRESRTSFFVIKLTYRYYFAIHTVYYYAITILRVCVRYRCVYFFCVYNM